MASVLEMPAAPMAVKLPPVPVIPPLEPGASLLASEFMRRYEAMPEAKKAELIDGTVFMGSPVSEFHSGPDQIIQTWAGVYVAYTPRLQCRTNGTIRFDGENVAQPDLFIYLPADVGGKARPDEDGYVVGAPELIVEIAATSASLDLHKKLELYQRAGVREYLVWRTLEGGVNWFVLVDDEYRPNLPDEKGLIRSPHFPGLCLDVNALLAFDRAKTLSALEAEMKSEAHAAFVASLQKK